MNKCEFCGSEIHEYARFCGQCGRAQGNVIEALTGSSSFQLPNVQDLDAARFISISGNPTPQWHPNPHSSSTDMPFTSSNEETEEDDRRRYYALLDIPLFESLAEKKAYPEDVPMLQVTP